MVKTLGGHARAVRVDRLTGRWGEFQLHPVSISVAAGEYLVLLGPSGCGKTTLAELLCGLRKPSAGSILIGDDDVTLADPADRGIGYVPQDYALFPTRTVEQNIRFAPRVTKARGVDVDARFAQLVEMLHVRPILKRNVQMLSGGERQRVALGRALMAEPDLLLLDEPVSALPESFRDRICGELKELHVATGLTTVHISHNLEEALSVGDRLAVMDIGRVVQVGTPDEVLDRPATKFVAEFMRCRNIWAAEVRAGRLRVGQSELGPSQSPDGLYWAVVRPEHLRITHSDSSDTLFSGRVLYSTRSSHTCLTKVNSGSFDAWVQDDKQRFAGDTVGVSAARDRICLIPKV